MLLAASSPFAINPYQLPITYLLDVLFGLLAIYYFSALTQCMIQAVSLLVSFAYLVLYWQNGLAPSPKIHLKMGFMVYQ